MKRRKERRRDEMEERKFELTFPFFLTEWHLGVPPDLHKIQAP